MAEAVKRVVYFEVLQHEITREMLEAEADIVVTRLDFADAEDETWGELGQAHGYHVKASRDELPSRFQVGAELLARTPELLIASSYGAGYDTIDVPACSEAGVIVINQSGGNREAVAEHALAMMLALSKQLIQADRALRRHRDFVRADFLGRNIEAKTIGIVGLGEVGSRIAELCGGLFAMKVLAHDPYLDAQTIERRGGEPRSLEALLAEADIVSINCPLTAETRGMIDRQAFGRMKSGALFITTARGSIHDEAALVEALAEGRIGGAGLDVWEQEPPPLDHPLLAFDNVVASPHIAGVTRESRYAIAVMAAEQMIGAFRGQRPARILNPEVWPVFVERYRARFGNP